MSGEMPNVTGGKRESLLETKRVAPARGETSAVMPNWIAIGSTGRPQ